MTAARQPAGSAASAQPATSAQSATIAPAAPIAPTVGISPAATSVPSPTARPLSAEQWWIGTASALLCLLQLLALDARNPLTRTLSSYEYTSWGWMFPLSLVLFGVGIMLLAVRVVRAWPVAGALLGGAAVAAWVTACFPSGAGTAGGYWPGEVHRWGSIALMVLVLAAALVLLGRRALGAAAPAVIRLVAVGSLAGLAFLAGQALKPEAPLVTGEAPLAGGLTQRILVAAVAGVLLIMAAAGRRYRIPRAG